MVLAAVPFLLGVLGFIRLESLTTSFCIAATMLCTMTVANGGRVMASSPEATLQSVGQLDSYIIQTAPGGLFGALRQYLLTLVNPKAEELLYLNQTAFVNCMVNMESAQNLF